MGAAEPGRYQPIDTLPDDLISRVAKELFRERVDRMDFAMSIDHDHRGGRGFDRESEFLLGVLALSDVRSDTNHSIRLTIPIREELTAPLDPSHGTVSANDPIFDVMVPVLLDGLADGRQDLVTVRRMDLP